jgi:hypothetical protein
MSARRGNLQPAHRGYRYQDIATAYVLARELVDRYDAVVVDRKEVAEDRFDDLEVRVAGSRIRRQIKSSVDPVRQLSVDDFTGADSSLRIDHLVRTYVRTPSRSVTEFRLCATWTPPSEGSVLGTLLLPGLFEPTILGWLSHLFRLNADAIWPAHGVPTWSPLLLNSVPGAEFGRDEFVAFCNSFVIELGLPPASCDLAVPGPLERALIEMLRDQIGIGRYPNHGRSAADVSGLAISLANLARTKGESLAPTDVERELDIRVDFGRVAQDEWPKLSLWMPTSFTIVRLFESRYATSRLQEDINSSPRLLASESLGS